MAKPQCHTGETGVTTYLVVPGEAGWTSETSSRISALHELREDIVTVSVTVDHVWTGTQADMQVDRQRQTQR